MCSMDVDEDECKNPKKVRSNSKGLLICLNGLIDRGIFRLHKLEILTANPIYIYIYIIYTHTHAYVR